MVESSFESLSPELQAELIKRRRSRLREQQAVARRKEGLQQRQQEQKTVMVTEQPPTEPTPQEAPVFQEQEQFFKTETFEGGKITQRTPISREEFERLQGEQQLKEQLQKEAEQQIRTEPIAPALTRRAQILLSPRGGEFLAASLPRQAREIFGITKTPEQILAEEAVEAVTTPDFGIKRGRQAPLESPVGQVVTAFPVGGIVGKGAQVIAKTTVGRKIAQKIAVSPSKAQALIGTGFVGIEAVSVEQQIRSGVAPEKIVGGVITTAATLPSFAKGFKASFPKPSQKVITGIGEEEVTVFPREPGVTIGRAGKLVKVERVIPSTEITRIVQQGRRISIRGEFETFRFEPTKEISQIARVRVRRPGEKIIERRSLADVVGTERVTRKQVGFADVEVKQTITQPIIKEQRLIKPSKKGTFKIIPQRQKLQLLEPTGKVEFRPILIPTAARPKILAPLFADVKPSKEISISKIDVIGKQTFKEPKLDVKQKVTPTQIRTPIKSQPRPQRQVQPQAQVQRQALIQVPKPRITTRPQAVPRPRKAAPIGVLPKFPLASSKLPRLKTRLRKGVRKFAPSLTALELNIRAPKPKQRVFTGLGIRPIPTGKRKKRRSVLFKGVKI